MSGFQLDRLSSVFLLVLVMLAICSQPGWAHQGDEEAHYHNNGNTIWRTCSTSGQYATSAEALVAVGTPDMSCAVGGGCVHMGCYDSTLQGYLVSNGMSDPDENGDRVSSHSITYGGSSTCLNGLTQNPDGTSCGPQDDDESQDENCPSEGNPIAFASGNKFQPELDYAESGVLPLRMLRRFNSLDGVWRFSYERHLEQLDATHITAWSDRGGAQYYTHDGTAWVGDSDNPKELTEVGANFELLSTNGEVEHYNASGQLTSIENRAGQTLTFAYNASSQRTSVTHFSGRTLSFTYDIEDRMETFTDPAGNLFAYGYDTQGRLASIAYPDETPFDSTDNPTKLYHYEDTAHPTLLTGVTDENGSRYSTFAYDAKGRGISTEHFSGVDRVEISYNVGSTVTVKNSLLKDTIYTLENFEGVNRITQVAGQPAAICGAMTSSMTYDANGYLASRTDNEGNVTTFVHDSQGRETSRTEASGTASARTITITWHGTHRVPTQIVRPGQTVTMTYDSAGRVLTETTTDTQTQSTPYSTTNNARTTTYTYNALGLVATIDGPQMGSSDTTTFVYDANGDPTTLTNALGQTTTVVTRDARGLPTKIKDANNLETDMVYDTRGRLASRTVRSGQGDAVTSFAYEATNQLSQLTLPDSSTINYEYDAAHRLVAIENALQERIEYSLDNAGNRLSETIKGPGGSVSRSNSQSFDELSRMISFVDGVNNTTTYDSDDNDNPIGMTDALTRSSTQVFDALDRLTKATDAASGDTHYSYDDRNNLTQVIDPKGVITGYVYDGLDNVIQELSADAGNRTYYYDAAGNMTQSVDARGIVANYVYDVLNRMTSISYPTSTNENVTYTYDSGTNGIGRLASITDESGSTTYTYDDRGNVLTDTRVIAGTTYSIGYSYDLADQRTSMTYPSGRVVDYTRDTTGRLSSISHTVSGLTEMLIDAVQYEPFGGATALAYGNGTYSVMDYDSAGRVSNRELLDSYNGAPVALADGDETTIGASITLNLLANDRDFDGDTLSIFAVTQPSEGTVTINPDQTVTFASTGTLESTQTFTYQAGDGTSPSNVATVVITVVDPGFIDSDGDGLDDALETALGLDPNDATDTPTDADGDGVSNYDEYIAGTDPLQNANGYVAAATAVAPAAHWTFDDSTSGQASDSSGNNRHMTLYQNYTQALPSVLETGSSTSFDQGAVTAWYGSGNAANSSGMNLNQDFTIQGFIRWKNGNLSRIFEKYTSQSGAPGPILYANSGGTGRLAFHTHSNARVWSTTQGMSDNRWRHFAFVRRGTRMEIWINGKLDASADNLAVPTGSNSTAMRWMGHYATSRVTGGLDNITVHQQALEPARIVAAFNSQSDKDLDQLDNVTEMTHGLDPLDATDALSDLDGDGYSNADEINTGTDLFLNSNGYGPAVLADGPLGYWRLDDATGVIVDDSGNGLDGAFVGGPYTQLEPSPISAGYSTAFAGNKVAVPHDASLNVTGDFTVEGYFKWTSTYKGLLFSKSDGTYPYAGPTVYVNWKPNSTTPGRLTFMDQNENYSRVASLSTGLNDGQWRHYAFVRKGNELIIYINGLRDASLITNSAAAFNTTNDLRFMGNPTSNAVVGSADEVAFYDKALSQVEIMQHVKQGQEPNIAHRGRHEADQQFAQATQPGRYLAVTRSVLPRMSFEDSLYRFGDDGELVAVEGFTSSAFNNALLASYLGTHETRVIATDERTGRRLLRQLPKGRTGLIPVSGGSLSESWTYSYDAVSNITGISKPGGADAYDYDALDRLDSYTLPGSSEVTYGYDAVGNRLTETQSGVTQQHTYGSTSNRQTAIAGAAVTYDANGNRLTDQAGARSFTYNHRNRMTSLSDGTGNLGTYLHNALGQRVNKVAGSDDIDFVYDLSGQLIGEYNNGSLIREYVYVDSQPIAQLEPGKTLYLHADQLGTPREATNANAQVVWRWASDPFGEMLPNEDVDGDSISVTMNLRYPGQYVDDETGIHYNNFRSYDPATARYTQSDPIGLSGGKNRYAYVNASPLRFADFFGLAPGEIFSTRSAAARDAMSYSWITGGGGQPSRVYEVGGDADCGYTYDWSSGDRGNGNGNGGGDGWGVYRPIGPLPPRPSDDGDGDDGGGGDDVGGGGGPGGGDDDVDYFACFGSGAFLDEPAFIGGAIFDIGLENIGEQVEDLGKVGRLANLAAGAYSKVFGLPGAFRAGCRQDARDRRNRGGY